MGWDLRNDTLQEIGFVWLRTNVEGNMYVKIPHKPFNTLARKGKAGEIIVQILKELQPESLYFTEQGGARKAIAPRPQVTREGEASLLL
jgi:hypothetical protein